jgi:ParB family chromosome partitioning protein
MKKESGFGSRVPGQRPSPPAGGNRRVDLSEFEKEAVAQARAAGQILNINKDLIDPDPEQPRTHFDEASLEELARSLEEVGQIQPIIVRETGNGRYTICCGERRWRAAKKASLTEIQAVVRNDLDPLELLRLQVQENEQRESMNPLDLGRVYSRVLKQLKTQKAVAAWADKSEAYISTYLQLTEAPKEVQELSTRITDATALQLISRLVQQSPEEGNALLEQIRTGAVHEGSLRKTARDKLAKAKPEKSPASPKKPGDGATTPRALTIVKALKAEWQHDGDLQILRIETAAGPMAIELPSDFKGGK